MPIDRDGNITAVVDVGQLYATRVTLAFDYRTDNPVFAQQLHDEIIQAVKDAAEQLGQVFGADGVDIQTGYAKNPQQLPEGVGATEGSVIAHEPNHDWALT